MLPLMGENLISGVPSYGRRIVDRDAVSSGANAMDLREPSASLREGREPATGTRGPSAPRGGQRPCPVGTSVIDMESHLAECARRGQREALEQIVRRQTPQVERLLLRLLGPRHDLEDLMQTVFLKVCSAFPGFRGESRISAFVVGITVREAKRADDTLAWEQRRTGFSEEPASERLAPEQMMHVRETIRRSLRALAKLSWRKRRSLLLWALAGWSSQEIAEWTNTSEPAVRSQVYYARKELLWRAQRDPYLREYLSLERP